ncbi:alpha/beta fold hydrolase [Massilia sp. IC2-278]|uniref:alpha/beta fold hydrolase n=1 Tax=Massilia sp. IC2-278 TaxID=2887200 RepID=UPI001E4A8963|nr:alpha/beta fold hydrolase [Massilia sp. IC2-278]MCC2962603.1 alpha/beta fold hydrolase [Massilia sp. IC2-278]
MPRLVKLLSVLLLSLPILAGAACEDPAKPIDEQGFVAINGIEQWVTIKGQRCGNPVVLMVHGGPGNPLTPLAHNIFATWEKDFTMVHWDQRGSGMTWGRNRPAENEALTMEILTADGLAVADYAARHLGKRKLLLWGSSWGSMLGIQMAHAKPALFDAYIGAVQVISYKENETALYNKLLQLARAANDQDAIGKLEALGAPPWSDPRAFGIARRIDRKYEAKVTDPAPASWWKPAPAYATPKYEADYEAGEDYSFLQFVGLKGDGMFSRYDLHRLGTGFALPVYFVMGQEDILSSPEVARRYFDRIEAPHKRFVVVPRAGHDPNEPMIAAQLQVLREAAARAR